MKKLSITICGCGNGAHACGALMSQKGHIVNYYSPFEKEVENFRRGYARNNGMRLRFGPGVLGDISKLTPEQLSKIEVTEGLPIHTVTSDPAEVIPQSDLVFVIVPAFAHQNILLHIRPYLSENCLVIFLPCRSGLEFQLRFIAPNVKAIGFQTLPWSTRINPANMGEEVAISARKVSIQAASCPADLPDEIFAFLSDLLDMQVIRIKHMLTLSLANVGQIIHPGISYSIFKEDPYGSFEEENAPLFYQGVSEEGAARLSAMSDDIIRIAHRVAEVHPIVEADKVRHLSEWVESSYGEQIADKSSLHKKLTTNAAYSGLRVPYVKDPVSGLCHFNMKGRYLTEDIPYGLLVTRAIAAMFPDLETPAIDEVLKGVSPWTGRDYFQEIEVFRTACNNTRVPGMYGCGSIEDLI